MTIAQVNCGQPYCEVETIFDMAFDLITVSDANGVFLRVSKTCAEFFGIPLDQIIGASAYDLENKGVFDNSVTVMVLNSRKEVTLVQKTKSGKKLLVSGKPLFDAEGRLVRVINISKDITREEALKVELRDTELLLDSIRRQVHHQEAGAADFIGTSPAVKSILELAASVAPLNTTVLLLGETGVGKGIFARKIHRQGLHGNEPFININCGAIPATLLESELFGYVAGAYTGAQAKGKEGLLVAAKSGTVFLDEISEMPLDLQVKLLHVLQEKSVTRLGGLTPTPIAARFIAAANKDLKKLVEEGKFREDLYYRLNIVPIVLPPLRERRPDIALLIHYFAGRINDSYGMLKEFSPQAVETLERYPWPGNVRELENMVERLIVTTAHSVIKPDDVIQVLGGQSWGRGGGEIKPEPARFVHLGQNLNEALESLERRMLQEAFDLYRTTRKIGRALGIDQSTVSKKLKKYGISDNVEISLDRGDQQAHAAGADGQS